MAYVIWRGAGLSIQGVRTCGDYMFSGHTVALTMLNFFITECNKIFPTLLRKWDLNLRKRFVTIANFGAEWKLFSTTSDLSPISKDTTLIPFFYNCFFADTRRQLYFLHTFTWMLNMFGIFFILAAHEHYSIDVFVAFYITSRLFLYYHTLANNQALMQRDSNRTRIWFPLFSFFESSVDGIVPNEFEPPSLIICNIIVKMKEIWVYCKCCASGRVYFQKINGELTRTKKKR